MAAEIFISYGYELTNSRLGDDSSGITRYYSRDISTFLGEWGRLAVYDLSSVGTFSWAAELAMFFDDGTTPTNGLQYVVGTSGAIEKASPNNDRMYTRCRD